MNLAQANITKTGQNVSSGSSHGGGSTGAGGTTRSNSNSNKRKASAMNVDSTEAASKRPTSKRARRSTTVYNS